MMDPGNSINHQINTQSTTFLAVGEGAHQINDNIEDSIPYQTNEGLEGIVGSEHGVSGSSNDIGGLIRHLNQLEEDIKDQLRLLGLRGKKPKATVDHWLNVLEGLKRRAGDKSQLGSSQIQIMTEELEQHKANMPVVVSNEFVGEGFKENVRKIWELLRDDKVFIIGIHGMGGVGKTFLATYMENEIKRKKAFNHVLWVTVSHDFAIFKLQQQIAERMGVKLYGDDERTRATILASELAKIENSVLILDDVWRYIDLEKMGIPLKMNGIKLIVTSRLKHVCQQMDCQPNDIIPMNCLLYWEGWELFLLKFGHHEFPPEVEEIAKSVINKCNGLPLAINVMARTMKGKYDIHWWKHAFNKLINLEMEEEILTVLKRSYDYLTENVLQECFLHSALVPTDVSKSDWVIKVVESGMLNEKRSLEELIDEGFVIIDELMQHSLLLEYGFERIRMHYPVRNMACHILNESRSCIVKCWQKLIKIPDIREWTDDLEIVSLACNHIKEIVEGTSPECPRLSTLILSSNYISHIPESFFIGMNALTLLDLSFNRTLTSLPNSLSNLKSLISLLLKGCSELKYIPPLGELQELSKLDISYCYSIHKVPLGLENLINLKWLDLSENRITLPGDVLSCLTNMQYLDVRHCSNLKAEDMKWMSMLECFAGHFRGRNNYNNYVRQTLNKDYGPKTYFILFFEDEDYEYDYHYIMYKEFNRRRLYIGDCTELPYLLPRDLVDLRVHYNDKWEYLCAALSSEKPPPLKTIEIDNCKKLKRLFCLGNGCSTCTFIQSQHTADFRILKHQTRMEVFRHLTHFEIHGCDKIEMLLTPELVSSLRQLESIEVRFCESMKEIFGDSPLQVKLPNLTELNLWHLPQLHIVCKQVLLCASQNALFILDCPNLKERPTIVVQ
ncbi:hypothetical protein Fmac_017299 [Flemingia macrophylla]|uniref:NB-ARC domain-containing protein n=1 Tax=Flemingia macrophylla TaxID=520843 RepID=A0ABD1M2E0_9FABA